MSLWNLSGLSDCEPRFYGDCVLRGIFEKILSLWITDHVLRSTVLITCACGAITLIILYMYSKSRSRGIIINNHLNTSDNRPLVSTKHADESTRSQQRDKITTRDQVNEHYRFSERPDYRLAHKPWNNHHWWQ